MSYVTASDKPANSERCYCCGKWVKIGVDGGEVKVPDNVRRYKAKAVIHNSCLNVLLKGKVYTLSI